MVVSCCAFGCTERAVKGGPVTFHCFPKDEEKRKIWEIKIRRENFKATKASRLCSKHFSPDSFDRGKFGGTWLKKTAVPTIFNFPKHVIEQEHFTDDNFVYQPFTNHRQLKKDAIPTLFSLKQEENRRTIPEKPSNDDLPCRKDGDKASDSSDSEFINSEIDSDEMEENNAALLDVSMNEKFYSPEQLETSANDVSKCTISNPKCHDILEEKKQLKKQLKSKIFLKALKKQWLDAEIKAATAKKDYYETKNVMLTKLQNDLDFENSSDFETSTALQNIKVHLKKEELASNIEKKMLKQQLEEAKIAADNCEKEYYEAEFGISFSDM
ncbi:hypothetical protein AVEN_97205-2 [Araneus ventricosus]|uniref:THAP-type domain-containing protein n=1 Tax=Araneus ventricosus TaxID=182803 RepID=A0A4Y2JPU1_ARAVE|nr:hypothetical protein AVEN_97205-2 [Araneus ventricosus]